MADDEAVWLRTVQEAKGHTGEGWVKQRALPFDDLPMIFFRSWRQPFCSTGNEIGNHSIKGKAATGYEHASLTSCTERAFVAAFVESLVHGKGGVLFTDRTVCPNCQDPLSRPFGAFAGCKGQIVVAHIVKLPVMRDGSFRDFGNVAKTDVEPGGDVHTSVEGFNNRIDPMIRQSSSGIHRTDDHGFGTRRFRICNRHVGQACICFTTVEPDLPNTPVLSPIYNAGCGLCSQCIVYVAEKQKIGTGYFHGYCFHLNAGR